MRYLVIFSFFSSFCFGQKLIPQLRKEFYSTSANRIENAIKLRDFYLDESPDSIFNIGSFLINQGIKSEDLSFLNFGKLIISSYYNKKGKTEISRENLTSCILYYEKRKDYEMLADAQNLMGVACFHEQHTKEAINWFLKSLKSADLIIEEHQSYMAQINMVEAFIRLKDYESAEKEAYSFLDKVKQQKLNKGIRRAYDMLAKICFATEKIEEGIKFYQKSLDLALENGDKLGLSFAHNNIAIAYFEMGDLQKTLENFNIALKYRKEINNPNLISESYFNLGEYYFYTEKYDDAISQYMQAKKVAEKFNLIKENTDATQRLAECLELKGDFKSAYQISLDFANLQSELNLKIKSDDAKINENYSDFKENEQKITQKIRENTLEERLKKSIQLNWILVILFISLYSILSYLFFNRKR